MSPASPQPLSEPISRGRLDRVAVPTEGIFVGRQSELEVLHAGLNSAQAGRGRLILLAGEPGIGKTRTAHEFANRVRRQDTDVAVAHCHAAEGAPPFWPWARMVRALALARTDDVLREEMGGGAADIARAIPAVRERLPDLPLPPALDAAESRFRFFDSVSAFFRNAGRGRPLVLIVDDLHEADRASLHLLEFLTQDLRDARVLVVGTYRDVSLDREHPLSHTLGELVRTPDHQRLFLEGLSHSEVARFVELTVGTAPQEALVTSLHRRTEGNPFFLTEVVRALVGKDNANTLARPSTASAPVLPQGVREAIGCRLEALPPECRHVLSLASVIGREFDLETLAHMSTVARDGLLSTLDVAVAARLIVEQPLSAGRYSFVHALFREALYADLPTARRQQLHLDIGEALEKRWGIRASCTSLPAISESPSRAGLVVAELAYHFFEAARGGDEGERAIAYAIKAGEQAIAMLAYEEAVEHYQRALKTLERVNPGETARRCELLLALGSAQMKAGEDVARARKTLFQAAATAKRGGAPQLLARVALGFEKLGVEIGSVDEPLVTLLEEALAALPAEEESEVRARVLARLAHELLYAAPSAARRNLLSQAAVAIARRIGSPGALAAALHSRRHDLWDVGHAKERVSNANEMIRCAEMAGDRERAMRGRIERMADLLELGEIAAVDVELDAYLRMAEELRQPRYLWYGQLVRATRALLDGRFQEGEDCAGQALALGQQVQPRTAGMLFGAQLVWSYREQGRLQELETAVQDFVTQSPSMPAWRSALASLYCDLGREAEARREFERLAASAFADLPRDNSWLIGVTLLGEVCAFLGDAARAMTLYDLLRPYAEHNAVSGGDAVVCSGPASRILGLLAGTLERWDEAAQHFEAALAMTRRMGARAILARVQCEYAGMLVARNQTEDAGTLPTRTGTGSIERSRDLLNEAFDAAQELGMKGLAERVLALQRRLPPPMRSRADGHWVSGSRGATAAQTPGADPAARRSRAEAPGEHTQAAGHVFRQEGDYWTLVYQGRTCRLRDTKGLRAIALLLRAPGQEFHVLDMMAMLQGGHDIASRTALTADLLSVERGDAGVVLDPEAKAAYRRSLSDLRDELAEAEQLHDLARAGRAQAEIEWLNQQLSAALGLGGQDRKMGASAERARSAITKSIKTAIRRVRDHHRALGHHLATHIKTGTFCQYLSGSEQSIDWTL